MESGFAFQNGLLFSGSFATKKQLNYNMTKVQTYIYEKKHKSGNCSYVVRYKNAQNKWVSMSAGASKQDAIQYEAKIRQELFAGIDPRVKRENAVDESSVNDVVDYYLTHPKFTKLSEDWRNSVQSFLEREIRPKLGKIKVTVLKVDHFYRIYQELQKNERSNSTIRKYHHTVSAAFNVYCRKFENLKNPLTSIKISEIAPRQASTRAINFLMPEELKELFLKVQDSKSNLLEPFVRFLAFSGMRRSEALNLKWTDVDRKLGFFHIRKTKNKIPRSVPIENEAWDAISPLKDRGEFVFCLKDGSRPDSSSFLKPLKRCLKATTINKRVDLHTLRHSYGSNKIRSGWGLKKVSKLLGHTDIQMTANIYSHLLDGDLKVQDELVFDNAEKKPDNSLKESSFDSLVLAMKKLSRLKTHELQELLEVQLQKLKDEHAPHVLLGQTENETLITKGHENAKGEELKKECINSDLGELQIHLKNGGLGINLGEPRVIRLNYELTWMKPKIDLRELAKLRESGMSLREIERVTKVGKTTVMRKLLRFYEGKEKA